MGVDHLPRLFALSLVVGAPIACTTFANTKLEPTDADDTVASSAATTGTGGEGGGLLENDPDAYLPFLDASDLCAMVGECPLVAASIVLSVGIPIVHVDADAQRLDVSYSACMDWLTGPLAAGRIGFEAQQELLYRVLPAGCNGAPDVLPIEALPANDGRCTGDAPYCDDDGRLVDCAKSAAITCEGPPFGAFTVCTEEGDEARCGIYSQCTGDAPCQEDGSVTGACHDGVATAFDCASVGLACSDTTSDTCIGESGDAACDAIGEEACNSNGERASVCVGGLRSEIDCDAAGLACIAEGLTARCGDPQAECSPHGSGVDVCEEDILHACVNGARVDVDCAAIGRKCRPAESLTLFGETVAWSGRCAG